MNAKRKVLLPVVFVIALALIFSFAAFTLTACGDKDPTVTSIEISETLTVEAGMSVTPTVTITYSDGNTSTRTADIDEWVSSAPTIASVSAIGRVRGEAKGTAEITAKVGDVTSNVCTVTVTAGREVSILKDGQPITELTLDKEDDAAGVTLTAKVTREGTEVPDQEIEWESSDATKVTVANGLVKPVLDTEEGSPVTLTAKITGTNFSASIPVTVTWENKGNYTFDASTYEQNKSPAGIWNYWGDHNYNWTDTTISTAYVDGNYENGKTPDSDYIYIGAQKVTIQYKVDNPNANHAAVQLFYRSAGQDGKLQTNHNYEVKLKIESNVSGTVSLNDFRNVPSGAKAIGVEAGEITEGKEDSDYEKPITANEVNEISVQFRHGDSGAIYADGVYDNIESAIQLCIGKLAGDVTLSVYDIQYKDLGAATKEFRDDEKLLADYVPDTSNLPVPTENDKVSFSAMKAFGNTDEEINDDGKYNISTSDDGKSYSVTYTNAPGESYEKVVASFEDKTGTPDPATCNTVIMKIQNTAQENIHLRIDVHTEQSVVTGDNQNDRDCAVSSVAIDQESQSVVKTNTDPTWDGTTIDIEAGKTVMLYITYDVSTGRGAPSALWIMCNTDIYGDGGNNHSGSFIISDIAFMNVETE